MMKFILIILTTFLFACNNKPKETLHNISVEKKIEKEFSTTSTNIPFELGETRTTFPSWIKDLYEETEKTEYYEITHEVIYFNKINDSLSTCIINSNEGICAKYFLATQLSKKEIDFIELSEECDHEQSIPEHSWSEYKIINSKKVNTTEYNEFIPDSLLINGVLPIGKSLEDYESIKTKRSFEFKILKNGEIEKRELKQNKTITIDNQSFIGNIQNFYFLNNNEIYVELYFKKDSVSYDEYEKIVNLADSLIYQDDENSRSKISLDNAKKHLDLNGLDTINIFDNKNNHIENVKLLRIEYLNQNIAPCFIAVYETTKRLDSDSYYYCIGNFNENLDNTVYKEIENSNFTEELVDKFNVEQNYVTEGIKGIHYQLKNLDDQLSIINSDMYSMIIHTSLGSSKIYYKSNEAENIESIHILPLTVNGMPLIISESFRPETDMSWNNLLSFNGSNYIIQERQKVKLKTGANNGYN